MVNFCKRELCFIFENQTDHTLKYIQNKRYFWFVVGEYSPQLANPTKTRVKRPGVRRPQRNESRAERQISQKQFEKQRAQGTSSLSQEGTYRAGAGTSLTIKDNTARSPSNSCTKDKVKNLRARFEQMSS